MQSSAMLSDVSARDIFRPIHYLGSKLRILDSLFETVRSACPGPSPICDLFAGSGTVAYALSQTRPTVAVDIQEYSRVLCSALIRPATIHTREVEVLFRRAKSSKHSEALAHAAEPLILYEDKCLQDAASGLPNALCDLVEHGSAAVFQQGILQERNPALCKAQSEFMARLTKAGLADAPGTIISRYFGGVYFSYRQAMAIDCLLEAIQCAPLFQRATLLAAVLSSASDIVNTVGRQFAQPMRLKSGNGKPKPHLILKCRSDREAEVFSTYEKWIARYQAIQPSPHKHQIFCGDFRAALRSKELRGVRVVYADPPYTRDHYSRYYHVLETMCLRDNPGISTVVAGGRVVPSRGIYRVERHQSPFCIKSQAFGAFEELFAGVAGLGASLILSYSPFDVTSGARPRLMTIGSLEKLAKKYFPRVSTMPAGRIAHSKLNAAEVNAAITHDAEIFLVGHC